MKWERPGKDEYGKFYAPYVERAGEGDPVASMAAQMEEIEALAQLGEARAAESPSAGEWSAKEVLGHLCDFERVFAYRALRFSRGDEAPLHSFEQDDYVAMAGSNQRPLADLISEFVHLRRAMVMMFAAMDEETVSRRGTASGNVMSVRAVAFVTPGHTWTHLDTLRRDYPELARG